MKTHKLTIDMPNRSAEVNIVEAPNRFPNYEGTEEEMTVVWGVLSRAMARMMKNDRVIVFTPEEIAALARINGAENKQPCSHENQYETTFTGLLGYTPGGDPVEGPVTMTFCRDCGCRISGDETILTKRLADMAAKRGNGRVER